MTRSVAIVGLGRAGGALARVLPNVGWTIAQSYGRHDDPGLAARGVDLVLIATPDAAVSATAAAIEPADAVVAHIAGSLGLDALGSRHQRVGAMHPLMSLPDDIIGAERLLGGWFATAGDSLVNDLVADLGGRHVQVADDQRAMYHAIAVVASNHLTALLGQVERLAGLIDMPVEPFLDLAQGSFDSTRSIGAAAALTGPASRGDVETIERHIGALPEAERATYEAMMREATRLASLTDGA